MFHFFILSFIFLQADPGVSKNISDYLLSELGLAGIIIIAFAAVIVYLVKRGNKQSDKEKLRLIKEKDDALEKTIILYNELKDFQTDEIAKYYGLQENTNEINKQIAGSLDKFAGSMDTLTVILNKVIDKL